MTAAHTATPARPDQTAAASTTSADRRQDRQQHIDDQHRWRTVLSWAGFGVGCAVLVLCAFMVKNAADWDRHLGGIVPSFLIMFVLMVIAGKLILGGVDKAVSWIKQRHSTDDRGQSRGDAARP